ncbi:MAG: glycogen/starch synthase, partial [Candidatus Omnitrophota bacterium]
PPQDMFKGTQRYAEWVASYGIEPEADTIQKLEELLTNNIYGFNPILHTIAPLFIHRGKSLAQIRTSLDITFVESVGNASATAVRNALAGKGKKENLVYLPHLGYQYIQEHPEYKDMIINPKNYECSSPVYGAVVSGRTETRQAGSPVTKIIKDDKLLGVVVKADHQPQGFEVFTAMAEPFAVSCFERKKGTKGDLHYHTAVEGPNPFGNKPRQEFMHVLKGKIRAGIYTTEFEFIDSVELGSGDSIYLIQAHQVEFLEDTIILEVKQGPYPGTREKDMVILNPPAFKKITNSRELEEAYESVWEKTTDMVAKNQAPGPFKKKDIYYITCVIPVTEFSAEMKNKLNNIRNILKEEFPELEFLPEGLLHSTVFVPVYDIPYKIEEELGKIELSYPVSEMAQGFKANLIGMLKGKKLKYNFKGLNLGPDGAIFVQGHVEDETVFDLRKALGDIYVNKDRKTPFLHISFARITKPITPAQFKRLYERVKESRNLELSEVIVSTLLLFSGKDIAGLHRIKEITIDLSDSSSPLTFAFAAYESPYYKVGGLADVIGGLPRALADMGHKVYVFIPKDYRINEQVFDVQETGVRINGAMIKSSRYHNVQFYLIDSYEFPAIYGNDYSYNINMSIFFSRTVLDALLTFNIHPDIIYTNDWHTSLIPVYRKTTYFNQPVGKRVIQMLHNIGRGYQGEFSASEFHRFGLNYGEVFHIHGMEYYGKINLLKGGTYFADANVTVSPTYAQEVQTYEGGAGLDGVFADLARQGKFFGVLNGIDTELWNPAQDKALTATYGESNLEGKYVNKRSLQERLGLNMDQNIPIIGAIGRITEQKGFNLIADIADGLRDLGAQLVILGDGPDKGLINRLKDIVGRHPGSMSASIYFDEQLARQIYAGADILLAPSLWEPCGLIQMIGQRYGTPPIVREVG